MTNGMHMTVMYPEAVHYQKDGQWKDVDSTLAMTGIGDAAPLTDDDRGFGLKLTFHYTDGNTSAQTVNFNTSCDSQNNWQYAATPAVAEKAYSSVTVELVYSYNVNDVYFDGIQLFKEEFGTSYSYNDNGDVESVVDLQKKTTTYEYNAAGDLARILQDNQAKMTYEYDNYHNVIRATSAEGIVYEFTYDAWGNNTSVSIVYNGTKITSTAAYSTDGNILLSTTDALAKTTQYGYNVDTNVLEWVQYPNDTEDTQTVYTYDDMYRMVQASTDVSSGYSLEASYTYTDDLLTKITTNSSTYHFTYGMFNQISSIKVGTRTLASYTYTTDPSHDLQKLTYGNNDKIQYTYDTYGRVIQETFLNENNVITGTVTYTYDNTGALATVTDSETGIKTTYYYDFTDRLMKYVEKGTNYSHSVGYEYDTLNNLTELVETINGVEHTTSYTYDDDNRVTESVSDGITQSYFYDSYGRVVSSIAAYNDGFGLYRSYLYTNSSQGTSTQIVEYEVEVEEALITVTLSYDGNGNILSYDYGVNSTTYTYDSANQLVRENNSFVDKTWVWVYDDAGNILSRTEYAYTTGALGAVLDTVLYSYGDSSWGDLLTAYDGKPITYDGIGNPLTYDGWTFTWEHGRELASMAKNGVTWQYTYDANGMRTSRTNGATTYRYIYNGGQLTQMHKGADVLHFVYDAGGTQVALIYNGSVYYYLTTLQGDTFAIADSDGTIVVEYIYDAWGNILSTTGSLASTLGTLNPLRYRGYVYDTETGLYYLQSRYYNPTWGRFLNADVFVSTGQGLLGNNMFAYCGNNPVNCSDPSGFCTCTAGALDNKFAYAARCPSCDYALGSVGGSIGIVHLIGSVIDTVGSIVGTFDDWLNEQKKAVVQKVTQSLEKSKRNHSNDYIANHHIVPQNDLRGLPAYIILLEVFPDYGVDDQRNIIPVSSRIHVRLHSDEYYFLVNCMVTIAYLSAGDSAYLKEANVSAVLADLKAFISALELL